MTEYAPLLRAAAGAAGGVAALCAAIGVTRQSYHVWKTEGVTAFYAMLIAAEAADRGVSVDPIALCRTQDRPALIRAMTYCREA